MSENVMLAKIEELKSLEELIEEAKSEADSIRDSLKEEMLERDTEEMVVGRFILRWTTCVANRFDSATFKKTLPDLYNSFLRQVSSKRFSVSV